MRCARCDATLVTYALGTGDNVAVVCESCGFADVSATHQADLAERESWEVAMGRFEETVDDSARTTRVEGGSDPPTRTERTTIDGRQFGETGVSVGTALDPNGGGAGSTAPDEAGTDTTDHGDGGDTDPENESENGER